MMFALQYERLPLPKLQRHDQQSLIHEARLVLKMLLAPGSLIDSEKLP